MVKMYFHDGSKNHGCEAIVRGTKKIVDQEIVLYSMSPEDDELYGIDKIVALKEDMNDLANRKTLAGIAAYIETKLTGRSRRQMGLGKRTFLSEVAKDDVYLSIGGDNYCYTGLEKLDNLNYLLHKKGAKTVLWGCSVGADVMSPPVIEDLKRYDAIVVRETLSEKALHDVGIKSTVHLYPDPAFQLEAVELPLMDGFSMKNTIGINLSPLIMNCETVDNMTMQNYVRLIDYIIEQTAYQVALIPHVVKPENDDREPLQMLYNRFKESERVVILDDYNAMELKGFIGRCKMFIGARTHSTIAAYSMCVPTLVVGYSIKAKGIAKDIFGTYENYVKPVQSLERPDDLIESFMWLNNNCETIQEHLCNFIPKYKEKSLEAGTVINHLMKVDHPNG